MLQAANKIQPHGLAGPVELAEFVRQLVVLKQHREPDLQLWSIGMAGGGLRPNMLLDYAALDAAVRPCLFIDLPLPFHCLSSTFDRLSTVFSLPVLDLPLPLHCLSLIFHRLFLDLPLHFHCISLGLPLPFQRRTQRYERALPFCCASTALPPLRPCLYLAVLRSPPMEAQPRRRWFGSWSRPCRNVQRHWGRLNNVVFEHDETCHGSEAVLQDSALPCGPPEDTAFLTCLHCFQHI